MLKPVVRGHFLVVDRQCSGVNAAFVLLGRMSSELTGEHVQDFLAHPSAFGEGGEGEVVRVDFAQGYREKGGGQGGKGLKFGNMNREVRPTQNGHSK